MKLKDILLVVRDIENSKAFYKELFGLEVLTDFGGNVILTEGLVLQEQKLWEASIEKEVQTGGHDAELYFEENNMEVFMGTFIVGALLVGVVALIIRKIIRDKKNGKTCCGGDCGNCCGGCH